MATVRRWYLFLVSLISLQAVTWAIIALLRDLIASDMSVPLDAIAFYLAIILVGLPIYLVHWLWMQHLGRRDQLERLSAVRYLYFYGTLTFFLLPFINNAYFLVVTWLSLLFGENSSSFYLSPTQLSQRNLVAMVVLALFWFYHQRLVAKISPETATHTIIRRLYVLILSAVGLSMTTMGSINILQWLMYLPTTTVLLEVSSILALLIVGLPLWVFFWTWASRIFESQPEQERDSALRQFYLYAVIFFGAFGAVFNASLILQGLLSRLLALPAEGDIRDPLSIIIVMSLFWAYHTSVLRHEGFLRKAAPSGAGEVRRIYYYLVAAIGLTAFLIGLAGNLSILIRSLDQQILVTGIKEELTWFTSALIVGLPVWLLPWRQIQLAAIAKAVEGKEETRSLVRKIYLYFYIFVATMTVLIGAVYVVQQLLNLLFGERTFAGLLSDVGQAIAFVLIAIGVWFYHGFVLRVDGLRAEQEEKERLSVWHIVVVERDEGDFGQALLTHLHQELPSLRVEQINLREAEAETITTQLTEANLIIAPWTIIAPPPFEEHQQLSADQLSHAQREAIAKSAARKLLLPTRDDKWEWVGMISESSTLIEQTVTAVKQIIAGEEVKSKQPASIGTIVLSVIIGLFVLWLLLILLVTIVAQSF